MALLFMDGFDLYAAVGDLAKRGYSRAPNSIVTGRCDGSRAVNWNSVGIVPTTVSNYPIRALGTNAATIVVGAAIQVRSLTWNGYGTTPAPLFGFKDVSSMQATVAVNTAGNLVVMRGLNTATVATSTDVLTVDTWNHIEAKLDFATGDYEVRVNGEVWLAGTAASLITTANAYTNVLALPIGSNFDNSNGFWMDDLYVLDGTGSRLNDFLGDCRVETLAPTGDVSLSGWVPSTGSTHYGVVDEAQYSVEDYLTAAAAPALDRFDMADLSSTPLAVHAVAAVAFGLKADAGQCIARANVVSGGATLIGAHHYPPVGSVASIETVAPVDPNTGAAWSGAAVNALRVEVERVV